MFKRVFLNIFLVGIFTFLVIECNDFDLSFDQLKLSKEELRCVEKIKGWSSQDEYPLVLEVCKGAMNGPNAPAFYDRIIHVLTKLGMRDEAIKLSEEVSDYYCLDPFEEGSPWVKFADYCSESKVGILAAKGKFDEAIELCEKFIQEIPAESDKFNAIISEIEYLKDSRFQEL